MVILLYLGSNELSILFAYEVVQTVFCKNKGFTHKIGADVYFETDFRLGVILMFSLPVDSFSEATQEREVITFIALPVFVP